MNRVRLRIALIACAVCCVPLLLSACSRQAMLGEAIAQKNVRGVKLMLDAGASVDQPLTEEKVTPLMLAGVAGSSEITQLLIEHGAQVTTRDANGATALHHAAMTGDCPTIRVLVSNGAELDGPGANETTPLFDAVAIHSPDGVKCLIDLGADVNRQAANATPLLAAVAVGDPAVVKALLEADADKSPRNEAGQTAAELAARLRDSGLRNTQHSDEILRLLNADDQVSRNQTTSKKGR